MIRATHLSVEVCVAKVITSDLMVQVSVEGGICSSYSVLCFVRALGYRPCSRTTIWYACSIPSIRRGVVAWNVAFDVRRDFYRSSSFSESFSVFSSSGIFVIFAYFLRFCERRRDL